MRFYSQKTRENSIKTLFRALFARLWLFSGSKFRYYRHTLLPVAVFLLFVGVVSTYVNAKSDTTFKPEEESLHIFPTIVESTTWNNISTLGSQDLKESALFQEFDEVNSAYINTTGELPVINLTPETPPETSEPVILIESPATVDAISTSTSPSVNPATSTSEDTIVPDEIIPPPESGDQEDVVTEENIPEESEPVIIVPETIEEVAPVSEDDPQTPTSITEPVVSFFKRVTGAFLFTQSGTTTPIPEETATILSEEIIIEETIIEETVPIEIETVIEPQTVTETPIVNGVATTTDVVTEASTEVSEVASSTEGVIEIDSNTSTTSYQLTLRDFGVPGLESGQFIDNLQLRLSLAGQYDVDASGTIPSLDVSYSFGEFFGDAGSILIEEEISNAQNGGYYLIPLPSVTDPSLLSDLEIELTFNGELEKLGSLYVDAVWLEVGTVVFDKELLKQRYSPSQLNHLQTPSNLEFLGSKLDFKRDELPQFSFRYNSQRNFAVQAVRSVLGRNLADVQSVRFLHGGVSPVNVSPDITVTPEGLITVLLSEEDKTLLKPGVYKVEFEINEGGYISEDSFEFQWGLLSINSNQTEYSKGEVVNISMGALSPNGNTLCNEDLDLYITDPRGFISRVPVLQSGLCNGNNVVDVPDYSAQFVTDSFGEYEVYLERLNEEGNVIAHTDDTFFVVGNQDIAIERNGPTRIFPPSPYAMELTIHAKKTSFTGEITEIVPRGFKVFNTDAKIVPYADFTELVWDVSLLASTSETVSYEFDAPDLSPYLYELGPAKLVSAKSISKPITSDVTSSSTSSSTQLHSQGAQTQNKNNILFEEHRQWQIASDAVGNMIVFWDNGSSIPTDWSCLSCGSGNFYQRFAVGSSTYASTSGAATHTPTGTGSVITSTVSGAENFSGSTVSGVSHTHTYSPTISTESNLPSYRQLRVIQYTGGAGEPANIPAGAIGIFDVASSSLPSGWNRYDAQDGYYVRGEDTPGTTGGSDTHAHTVSGTSGAAAGSNVGSRGGGTPGSGAPASHTHTVSTTTPTINNEPQYIEVVLAQISATGSAPNNLITMWTEDVPSGWVDVSSSGGDAFNNKFIKASTTYGATGGADTHAHSDITGIVSSGSSGTSVVARTGTAGAAFTHAHNVDITSISTDSNLPPYVTAVFGKRQGTNPVYTQESFRWYDNENAQTPTDPWPPGVSDLLEGVVISTSTTLVANDDVIRLRINASVENATATAGTRYKLQYAATNNCSAGTWSNVGDAASSTVWRGYNTSVTDHGTLGATVLASTTVGETFEENGYATGTPSDLAITDYGEWDFVLEHNGALAGTNYCFRMIEDDGTAFSSYANYAELFTNRRPDVPTLSTLFDNEKTPTTTPVFTFVASDDEGEKVDYQIQVDDDFAFGSTIIDDTTAPSNSNFINLVSPAEKAPFTHSQEMQFDDGTVLSNGTTYWWRVRARDVGSDEWGSWASSRSFTVDTTLTVSAWFQTTEEQFDTDTLSGVESLATDEVDLITGSTTGSIITPGIDFDDGTLGSAWGELQFNDTETAGDIKYGVEYFTDAASWVLIPDADLSGNSTGFDTSPVSLLNLDTVDYNVIRIVADFTDVAGSPSLQDWTIEWGFRVETPSISKLFANEKAGTTTPTFEFTTTDPQSDSLTYQMSWSTDNTFTSSTTRASDGTPPTGFINSDNGGDTDPFNSGDTIQFTVQGGDALTDGSTYWWRVRAKDTTGDDVYSLWTDIQSFTVATDTIVSTWFQTTEEQFETDILSGTQSLATDEVAVATTATEALIVYGEGVATTPRYRQWDGSSWGAEGSLADVGAAIKWAVVRAGTQREEYVAGTISTDADVNVQVFSTGAWGNLQEVTTSVGDINARGFDIAYETLSGDAMVVYCDGDADPSYYIWDGTSWTSGGTINFAETNNCEWIRLASDPVSDEIIVISGDAAGSDFEAWVWNGSTWGNSTVQGGIVEQDYEGMAIAYEESGGQAVIVTSDGAPGRFRYDSWNGTAWAGAGTQPLGDDFEWGNLVADVGSDELALCYIDNDLDIGMVRWTGSAWAGQVEIDADGNAKTDPAFACVFEDGGSRDNYIMTVLSDTAQSEYSFWNNTLWSTNAQVDTIGDASTMALERTGTGEILGVFFDDPNDTLLFSMWDGVNWASSTIIEDNASVGTSPYGHPYALAPRNDGKKGTTIVSPGINFTDGVGPYWQEMSWVDVTPGASDILYSMQYYDTASSSWKFIPNSDLPGNVAGTSTSPIDLSALSVSTYSTIRPYASLSCDGANNCPTFQDWTVKWAEGIAISGTLQQYNQSTNVAAGLIAVAVNGTLQIGKTGSVSGGVWSISNVTTSAGDIVTVFVSGATDATEAVGVTIYDGTGNIEGFQMYERHVALGSNDATSTALTNGDVAVYNVNNDEDVFLDILGSTLDVCASTGCSDAELYINASTTFTPGGNVATHDIEINGTLVATTTLYIEGSWDNNATTTMTGSSVIFAATSTTESIDETGAISPMFNNITFGTTTGNATWTPVTNLDIEGDLTVERGTLSRGTLPITIAGSLVTGVNGLWAGIGTTTFDGSGTSNWADQNATLQNVGDVVVDGTSKTILLTGNVAAESITIGADEILDVSGTNYDITLYGSWVNNNTFASRSGEVFFAATTTGSTITAGGDEFYDLSFTGVGGDWSFTETTLTVNNDLTVATGTVTMPTATTTLAGSFSSVGGTFMHSNSIISFTSTGAETIAASGTPFLNSFYDMNFNGSGSWTFIDTNATSSHDVLIEQGTVTFPSGTFTVGGSLKDTGGSFVANGGTVILTSTIAETLTAGGSSFNNLTTTGSGSWTFSDTDATIAGDLIIFAGTLVLPTGTLSLGGSLTNSSTLTHSNGEILFNSTDAGETIDVGSSPLYDATFNGTTGGWTVSAHATTTNNFTIGTSSAFTLASGQVLSVIGTFTNGVGGASTTWTGSTLDLRTGAYNINTKTDSGDVYATLDIAANTDISMWNSSATVYVVDSTGSLYSQDHAGVDGDLNIYGSYPRTSGTEYWSYATDFDGTDLTGGSERLANVNFASGASAVISNSTLEILGDGTASTTISNQGSGTYVIDVTAGTTTAQYYDFNDLGATGLSLLSGNEVTSLLDGAFEVDAAGGTALTVSSTTIDANPALQIYRVDFATTTAIAATNVTQTDGTPASYWWFRDSTGNIDGEANDNDTGNPGSIRWDDSALQVTISGTVYTDDGVTQLTGGTCDGVATPVRIVVEGGSSYTATCSNVDGSYSTSGVTIVGDPTITVYLDNASGGEDAVAVTKTVTADVLDMDLYVNRVIVRHEDVTAMTIADMAAYDSSDDSDIQFTAATGTPDTLTVAPDKELHVWATTTFTPGGTVTLNSGGTGNTYDGSLHISNDATFTGETTTTYSIGGIFTLDSGATFVPASTTVLMTATTSGKAITTVSTETLTLNELQFTGAGGAWNINGNISATDDITVATGTVTGTGDITLTNGSFSGNGLVSLGGGTTTIEVSNTLGGPQGWTFNNLILGNGAVVGTTTPASTATTTVGGFLEIATAHFLDAGSSNWDLSGTGSVFVENGTFLEDTSTLTYSGVGATDVLSTDYYNLTLDAAAGSPTYTSIGVGIQVLNDLFVGANGTTTVTFDTNDTALNIEGDITLGTLGTFIASDSGSFTAAGSYDNNGTYIGSGGVLIFDGSGVHTIAAGLSSFSSVTINGTGDFTVSENATATASWVITAANDFTLGSGNTLSVGGTFTNSLGGADTIWTNSTLHLYGGGNYEINPKTVTDTYGTLSVAANTHIRMWNSDASTTPVSSSGSLYSMDNSDTAGNLYIYGSYPGNGSTDYWSYATDFDGAALGGGSRKVDVFFESGGSAIYTTGGLEVLGTVSASTTIQNQGSGVYSMILGGTASTSWSYYQVRNTDASGLVFTGTPTVATLSFGDFLVSTNNGTGITVGGLTINANPAKTFTQNTFASSSGIAADNVTATGTSVSSWRFTNHSGNIAGEAFDVDPGGDPGYIVWDDSAASITISGNVYSDEVSTVLPACDGTTPNVKLWVAGVTTASSSCDGGTGAYSMSGLTYSPGDSIIVYIDGEVANGATVTVDPVSNIADMDIYQNRVIVRHESTDPINITDLAVYDSNDDGDIPFTAEDASPDTLVLPANTKLIVWTGKEFAPGGNVTLSGGGAGAAYDGTLEMYDNGDFTSLAGESHSIGGSLITGTGSVFDASTALFTFTTTGAARTIDTNDAAFYDMTFNGTGSWTVTNTTLDANDVTITDGDVTLPSSTTTISGSLDNTGGSFDSNSGVMIFDSSVAETIRASSSDFATLTITGTGSFTMQDTNATATESVTIDAGTLSLPSGTFAIGGNFRNEGGAVTHNTSELILSNAVSATLLASSSDLSSVTMNGGGAYTMDDNSLTLLGSLTITSGTATLATGTLSIGGSFDASGGAFDNATGTILFNSADTGEIIDPGVSPFYNVNIAGGSGGWTITADATTTNNLTLSSASSFTLGSGNTLTVEGVFTNSVGGGATTWSGSTLNLTSETEYSINTKSAGGDDYQTLTIGSDTDISAWNSKATTTTVDASSSFYSQDHSAVDGSLYIFGDYHVSTTTEYWSYATDFDGTALGGSPRAVTVEITGNATTTVDGGTLNIIGTSGNETAITNQGSGTYSFGVNAGTYNAQYYQYRNLDISGLNLSGTPVITSLDYGDFELAVAGGNLISLSSSTLNANASLVIIGARFATTTAITGENVDLSGTTASAWTLTSHTGNLDGESYDNDGGSACGQVRWDDSSCLLTQQTHYRWRNDDGGIDVPASEWFDTDWDARKRVRIENADNSVYTDAVIELAVVYDADMQADFDDLRFTDSSGTTSIPYFIASSTNSATAEVWVKVPSIPANDTATIFMYYKNAIATAVSSSTETFIAADDFEDGGITEYSGDTSLFAVDGTYAFGGSNGLDNTGNESAKATDGIARFDQTVSQGEIIRYMQYINTGFGDETCMLFGVQSPVTGNQNYAVCLEQVGTDRISIVENAQNTDSSGTVLASTTVTYVDNTWYEVEIDWQTDDTIDVSLFDDTGTLIATTSATDNTNTSGGFGFTYWFNNGGWDNFTSRPRMDTEPTILFGVEQTDGGATWAADLDTSANDFSVGDSLRLRLALENTGLSVTDAYRLEYAEQGAAPSCEAVLPANFATVEPVATCGTNPVCMDTSATVADGANTSDLLLGTDGAFVAGKFVEDPSNTTASLTIDQDEYTEVEYSITTTINVSDQNICFRVTDAGSDLDTYLRVAKLVIRFDPSFGAVTFNDGANISLVPGTTTRVYATSTVTDLNGYSDIIAATSTMYTTSATAACTADNNNCYIESSAPQCTFTNCSGNSCVLECYSDIFYHASSTDNDGGEEWFAFLEAEDTIGGSDFATSPGVELLTLRALDVDSIIGYGSILVEQDSGAINASTTVENIGNVPIDIDIVGADLNDGGSSSIDANQQIFATSTFTYSTCTDCTNLATTSINYELDLTKPTTTAALIEDEIYWGINIPFGTASNAHTGVNTFYAIGD